jgi:hypothetical protein
MNHSDKHAFQELFHGLADYYNPKTAGDNNPARLSRMTLQITFAGLEEYSMDQISQAATAHIKDPDSGMFMPDVANLTKHLSGGAIKADQIVAAAKLAETPLGIMAKIHIGSWDLNRLNSFDLKQRAEEVLQLLPAWKVAAAAGEYSDHQITIMTKHGVDPLQPFYMGLAAPVNREALSARIAHVTGTRRHAELLEAPYQEPATASTGSTQVAQIARSIGKLENDNDG